MILNAENLSHITIDINIPYSMGKIPMLYGIFISIIFLVEYEL